MARLLINTGRGTPTACQLNLGVNRFGRHPDSEFVIEHPTISATHCVMILSAEGVLLRDCDSTNGTFLEGRPVKQAMLRPGQTVRLGDVTVLVESVDARVVIPETERPLPAPPVVLPDGTILCRRHPQAKATHRCTHCHELLCDACIHRLRRKGGRTLKLCGLCSHACEPLVETRRRKKSLFSRLSETIKLPFLKKNKD